MAAAGPVPATRWHALEVGCGLGLPGIVALSLGLHVTFSDYDATALRFAADNARLNGCGDFELLHMDWRSSRRKAIDVSASSWPADLIYDAAQRRTAGGR